MWPPEPGATGAVLQCRRMNGQVFPATPIDLEAGLRRLGYESFRPGQREAIETLMSAGRVLLVAPTGGGKSLTYQPSAPSLGGTTLVISPLVALMDDQGQALNARRASATFLASTLDGTEGRRRMARLARGEYSPVYVAPEGLSSARLPGRVAHTRDPR